MSLLTRMTVGLGGGFAARGDTPGRRRRGVPLEALVTVGGLPIARPVPPGPGRGCQAEIKPSARTGWIRSLFSRSLARHRDPLVLPARRSGPAAENSAHRYIGKVCCLLLVRADYIGRAPGRGPECTGICSSCYGDEQIIYGASGVTRDR